VSGRLLFVCGTLLVLAEIARGDGTYQRTKNGRALVWNDHPKAGDAATWSGGRDRDGFGRGFGTLTWYVKEPGITRPQFYARYWGNMIDGKFEGPVNVHSKRKTYYAIFSDGARLTRWSRGTAPSQVGAKWRVAIAKQRSVSEPEAPAEGPSSPRRVFDRTGLASRTSEPMSASEEVRRERSSEDVEVELNSPPNESVQDLTSERWPMIDIDDSLRLLAFPPRSLRRRPGEE
jgi:hypothetical protein